MPIYSFLRFTVYSNLTTRIDIFAQRKALCPWKIGNDWNFSHQSSHLSWPLYKCVIIEILKWNFSVTLFWEWGTIESKCFLSFSQWLREAMTGFVQILLELEIWATVSSFRILSSFTDRWDSAKNGETVTRISNSKQRSLTVGIPWIMLQARILATLRRHISVELGVLQLWKDRGMDRPENAVCFNKSWRISYH